MDEIRVFDFSRENREFAPHIAEGENSRRVEGYAIVFNQRSRVLYDKEKKKFFVEVIEPRAITKELLDSCDIKFLFNHDNNHMLGRSTFGYGSLSYEIDDYGVKFSIELPNTSDGNDVLELIRRGDIFGCSFAFKYDKDGVVDVKKNGENLRTIIKFASIHDFSIVVDPAYWGTFVSSRAFVEPKEEGEKVFPASLEAELENLKNI